MENFLNVYQSAYLLYDWNSENFDLLPIIDKTRLMTIS
jgi:hypothetical protein